MIHLYVADVGDGLAAGIRTVSRSMLQIDCGSQQSPTLACNDGLERIRPNCFFLSHFHTDHYNGLFKAGPRTEFDIRSAFFPRLPEFKDRQLFMLYELAMAYRVMGASSGSMEADFLNTLKRITRNNFTYRPLSQGDTVDIEGAHFEILWPPETLEEKTALAAIKRAITDFESALIADKELEQLYERVRTTGVLERYLRRESDEMPFGESESGAELPPEPRELPELVNKANDSLRAAANHMSLAFYEDNRFLFLGDLEKQELQQVAARLVEKRRTNFLATITPHHGTHWHPDLARIKPLFAVTSVGKKLIQKFRPEMKSFGRLCLVTHSNGEIHVPSFFDWNRAGRFPYWW